MKKIAFVVALALLTGVAFGQTIQKGAVVGLYDIEITLDPDVTMNQYLDFVLNESFPAWEKHMPGIKLFILKGFRGDNAKGYGLCVWCESKEVYKKYWDKEGAPTELLQGLMKNELKEVQEKAKKVGWMSWDFTDYVVL